MPDQPTLPLETWAKVLCNTRQTRHLNLNQVARDLLLSPAQLRGIESASMSAFHGEGYYLRAVQKYAAYLDIDLDPPLAALDQTDSQIALKRFNKSATVVTLARRETNLATALHMPTSGRGTARQGLWAIVVLAALLIGGGTYWFLMRGGSGEGELLVQSGQTAPLPTPSAPPSRDSAKPSATGSTAREVQAPTPTAPAAIPATPVVTATPTATPTVSPATNAMIPVVAPVTPATPVAAASSTGATVVSPIALQTATAQTSAPEAIEATFRDDCWVEVRFKDGRVDQKIYKPGETLVVPVAGVQGVVFGNAAAVSATLRGAPWSVMAFTVPGGNVARISEASLQKR